MRRVLARGFLERSLGPQRLPVGLDELAVFLRVLEPGYERRLRREPVLQGVPATSPFSRFRAGRLLRILPVRLDLSH